MFCVAHVVSRRWPWYISIKDKRISLDFHEFAMGIQTLSLISRLLLIRNLHIYIVKHVICIDMLTISGANYNCFIQKQTLMFWGHQTKVVGEAATSWIQYLPFVQSIISKHHTYAKRWHQQFGHRKHCRSKHLHPQMKMATSANVHTNFRTDILPRTSVY